MSKLNFCIVIPVYNEEEIIKDIIKKALKFSNPYKSAILLINDGSTDSTGKILSTIKNKKIKIINKKNEGHGKTLIKGYREALKLKPKHILQIDSDDQISFDEFKKLLKHKDNFDFVVGNRKDRDDPISRILISFLQKIIIFLLFGRYVNDPNCPLRIYNSIFLKKILDQVSFSNIPNVLTSIHAVGTNVHKSVNIIHKQRYTGSSIKYFKLFKECTFAFWNIIRFKFYKK
tara:strand:- start:1488 stop:2180 length:693 start_codon:yes stop_codon:yes gene_type:complete